MKYIYIVFLLLLINNNLYAQKHIFDASINGLFSTVHKTDIADENYYHYVLEPNYGYGFTFYYQKPFALENKLSATLSLGYNSFAYEGRHYAGLVEDSPEPEKMYRKYYWSVYRINNLQLNLGAMVALNRFCFSILFETNYILSAKEKRQEVYLTDVFDGDIYFPKKSISAAYLYNRLNVGLRTEIDYLFFKKTYLSIGYSFGINSIIQIDKFRYSYQSRILSIGIKIKEIIKK